MREIQAPNEFPYGSKTVFLAGSIEMGKARGWQQEIIEKCKDEDVIFLNPRRDDWDSSWVQSIHNKQFKEQVTWELDALSDAWKVVIYIDPNTTSPITLLELGIFGPFSDRVCVCCPEGFYRKGNVDIVCDYFGIPMVDDIDGLIEFIKKD